MALQDYECKVFGLYGGSVPWSFSFTLTSTDAESTIETRLDAALNVLWTTATDGIAHLTNADVTLEGSSTATLNVTQHETSKTSLARHIAGSNANPSLPWDNAVVIGFTGPSIIKADRGRIRLPAPAVDSVGSHVYTPAFTGHLKNVLDVFFPAVRSGSSTYYSANDLPLVDGTPAFTHHALDHYHISDKPGVVRRRTAKIVPTFTVSLL
jgi:hypothetical protein